MCELFCLSSSVPTTATFSMAEFARHGGDSGPYSDGWGIVFYDGADLNLVREAGAASDSQTLKFIRSNDFSSKTIVSHIRHATQGEVSLRNTQPFCRELRGRRHSFAHNGDLYGLAELVGSDSDYFNPVGETDSERLFCLLLERLRPIWSAATPPTLAQREKVVADLAAEVRSLGPANFIYSDGEYVFVHGHKRKQLGSGEIRPPGLYWLQRSCVGDDLPIIDGFQMNEPGQLPIVQKVVLIASVPLTDEPWIPLEEGELMVIKEGQQIIL